MLRKIHWILTSLDGLTKTPNNQCLYVEEHCALIKYENRKVKPTYYLIQIVDYDDPYSHWQEWFSDRQELGTDSALARAIGFYNIYYQSYALIEQGKMLMHYGNIIFAYDNEFKECMKVEGAVSEDIFYYLFNLGARKFLSKKGKKYRLELFEK